MERELDTNTIINAYIDGLKTVLDQLPQDCIHQLIVLLHQTRVNGNQVFIMGNGGSASTATHFVCDLAKNTQREDLPGFRVIGLTDNMALFSSLANDEGYENVFSQQLRNLVQPNDVVIAISGSGNSRNVLNAVEMANAYGARTVGLTGMGGGKLAGMVSLEIRVPSDLIQQVEDIHLMIEHLVCSALKTIQPEDMYSQAVSELDLELFGPQLEISLSTAVVAGPNGARQTPEASPLVEKTAMESPLEQRFLAFMQEALSISGARSITLILMDDQGKLSKGLLMREDQQVEGVHTEQLNEVLSHGLAGWVMRNRKPALVNNTVHDPRWLNRAWDDHPRAGRSAISIPLTISNSIIGTMTLVGEQSHQFTMQDLSRLSALAQAIRPGAAPL